MVVHHGTGILIANSPKNLGLDVMNGIGFDVLMRHRVKDARTFRVLQVVHHQVSLYMRLLLMQ